MVNTNISVTLALLALNASAGIFAYCLSQKYERVRLHFVVLLTACLWVFTSEAQILTYSKINEIEGLNMYSVLITTALLLSYN